MKIIFSVIAFSLISAQAFAKLPSEIDRLASKPGTFTSIYNSKSMPESGTNCSIEESAYGEGSVILQSVSYFTPTAHLDGATRSVRNGVVTYVTTDSGKRPGGSACGDYTPLTSYEKSVHVNHNSVTIKQKFRCAIFEKNEIIETCTVN